MNKDATAYRATMVGNPFRMRSVWARSDEQIPPQKRKIGADAQT
jgi:hypothetical protein